MRFVAQITSLLFLVFASCEPRSAGETPAPTKAVAEPIKAAQQPVAQLAPQATLPSGAVAHAEPPKAEVAPQTAPPLPPADPFDAIPDVERRTMMKRLNDLIEPAVKKGGAVDRAGAAVTELDARARALMSLSRYKLEFRDPKGEQQLIELVAQVKKFKPSGSSVRHGSPPQVLKLARKLLEDEQRRGAPINRAARLAVADAADLPLLTFRLPTGMPDISDKLLRLELTGDDLLPYLFFLDDCRRQIEWYRDADRKLYALIQTFPSDRDRFELIQELPFCRLFNIDQDFIRKDKELVALHGKEKARGYISDEFQAVLKKRVYPVFVEQARQYQRDTAEWFSANDKAAIDSLFAVEALQTRYQRYIIATVPNFNYKLKPVVPRDPDGKPLLEPLKPLTFDFDYADYVTFTTGFAGERYGGDVSHYARVKPLR